MKRTYQPKARRAVKNPGFRHRMRTKGGRAVLADAHAAVRGHQLDVELGVGHGLLELVQALLHAEDGEVDDDAFGSRDGNGFEDHDGKLGALFPRQAQGRPKPALTAVLQIYIAAVFTGNGAGNG